MNKIIIIVFTVFFVVLTTSCRRNAANGINEQDATIAKEKAQLAKVGFPEITFDNKEYDFGTVNEGDKVEGFFEFTNTGKSDLVISAAKASCGCTVPEYEIDKPIKPLEKGKIKFVFDTNGKPYNQNKTITVFCNTKNQNEIISIKGYVEPKNKTSNKLINKRKSEQK